VLWLSGQRLLRPASSNFWGDTTRAADYLRWSQQIQGRVLATFWPTIAVPRGDARPYRFADRQFDLGDTQYLIAEITPFSFNWRCDVLGNLLAYLVNLLDVTRARTALRFMWGVGVNQPWPVANLYPVVQAGDPDWRAYYTVNLLNLPHHYHNGGIWPFVGGMWVRFLHRLGFHDIACRELVRSPNSISSVAIRNGSSTSGPPRRHRPPDGQSVSGLVRCFIHTAPVRRFEADPKSLGLE